MELLRFSELAGVGGTLSVQSAPGSGSTIVGVVPVGESGR